MTIFNTNASDHLRGIWKLSRDLYSDGKYSYATFFAITLMEEIGKVIILQNYSIDGNFDKKGWTSHKSKYIYSVIDTLALNSRVTRIYGNDEKRFASWFRNDEIFTIRNKSLYLEVINDKVIAPHESISKEDAFLLVCIAGEMYAEIQGSATTNSGPEEWSKIIQEIDAFRGANEN